MCQQALLNITDLLDGINGVTYTGTAIDDRAGYSITSGDINNDGIDDVIIGAPFADPNGKTDAGQAYVVFGSSTEQASPAALSPSFNLIDLNGTNGFAMNGTEEFNVAGLSVSSGDVNGDGIDDVCIGAPAADANSYSAAGQVYVVYGLDSTWISSLDLNALNGTNGFILNGVGTSNQIGRVVSCDGDINGDGVDDILIGTRLGLDQFYLFWGSTGLVSSPFDLTNANMNGTNGIVLDGSNVTGRSFGFSVSTAGDINGDGIDDLTIGTPFFSCNKGRIDVLFGSNDIRTSPIDLSELNATNGFTIIGNGRGDFTGISVSSADDVNDDGINDIVIGSSGVASDRGAVHVVFGRTAWPSSFNLAQLNGTNGFTLFGINEGDNAGRSVSSASDVNGNEIDDIIITAPSVDKVFVVYGMNGTWAPSFNLSNLDGTNGFILDRVQGLDIQVNAVSSVGNVNGDGINDILIGTSTGHGGVNVVYGALPNNLCLDATFVAIGSVTSGSTNDATVPVGFAGKEPCGREISSPGIWYTLMGNGNRLLVSTCLSANYDTVLTVFDNGCRRRGNDAARSCIGFNDNAGHCFGTSELEFDSSIGVQYHILVHGRGGATGNFNLMIRDLSGPAPSVSSQPSTFPSMSKNPTQVPTQQPTQEPSQQPTQQPTQEPSQQPALQPTIAQPTDNDLCVDATNIMIPSVTSGSTVGATVPNSFGMVEQCGHDDPTESDGFWYTFEGNGRRLIASVCFEASFAAIIALFNGGCMENGIHGAHGCVNFIRTDTGCGSNSELEFNSYVGVQYHIRVYGFEGLMGDFNLTISDTGIDSPPRPMNDLCVDATVVTVDSTTSGSTTNALVSTGIEECGTSITSFAVWYALTGNGNRLIASTCNGTNFDTKLSVFQGGCMESETDGAQGCIGGNDDANCYNDEASEFEFDSNDGEQYHILVHGFGSATGNFSLAIIDTGIASPTPAPSSIPTAFPSMSKDPTQDPPPTSKCDDEFQALADCLGEEPDVFDPNGVQGSLGDFPFPCFLPLCDLVTIPCEDEWNEFSDCQEGFTMSPTTSIAPSAIPTVHPSDSTSSPSHVSSVLPSDLQSKIPSSGPSDKPIQCGEEMTVTGDLEEEIVSMTPETKLFVVSTLNSNIVQCTFQRVGSSDDEVVMSPNANSGTCTFNKEDGYMQGEDYYVSVDVSDDSLENAYSLNCENTEMPTESPTMVPTESPSNDPTDQPMLLPSTQDPFTQAPTTQVPLTPMLSTPEPTTQMPLTPETTTPMPLTPELATPMPSAPEPSTRKPQAELPNKPPSPSPTVDSTTSNSQPQPQPMCFVKECCEDQCCGPGTVWVPRVGCRKKEGAVGYQHHHSVHQNGCKVWMCCEADCCHRSLGTDYDSKAKFCLPVPDEENEYIQLINNYLAKKKENSDATMTKKKAQMKNAK